MALATIGMAVRFVSGIASGFLVCIVTGIKKAGDDEFITISEDYSLKVWDKFTEGVSYTIETHEPLTAMQVTGEKKELLICGQG